MLLGLATDQLFRKEFIDVRMPGYEKPGDTLYASKELVRRLQAIVDERRNNGDARPVRKPARRVRAASAGD